MANVEVLPNIRRKIEKTSTYTNFWLVRISDEHIFEVRHLENQADKFSVNLKEHIFSCRRWELKGLPCVHALVAMKSRNHKIDDYIPDYYRKSRYMEVYKHVIFHVNGSNMWVRIEYPDVQPPKYRKMPGRPKKRKKLEHGEIDSSDRKMRRIGFIVKYSRCKKPGHNKLACKVTSFSQHGATQASQQDAQGVTRASQ
ncbi:unnamed protein product [Lathyrus sativus]|nr:unnamed protein product [Lathyrus sativus]